MTRPLLLDRIPPPTRPWIFAIEDTTVQVTWRSLPLGPIRFSAADTTVEIQGDGGPGAVILDGLPPGTELELRIDGGPGLPRSWSRQRFRTLVPPPGAELYRFATISDMHVGEIAFGFRATLLEHPVPEEAHPIRAVRAALEALADWGAQTVVLKGDLTHDGRAKDFARIGRLLAETPVPAAVMLGNHDHYGAIGEPVPASALRSFGIEPTVGTASIDVPGLNLILVDTTIPDERPGTIAGLQDEVVDRLRSTRAPAFIALHHHGERSSIPLFLPRGIPHDQMRRFLDAVRWARPAAIVTSGHTHRHRRRHVGSLVVTEVGSTKDFPGTWAGYAVHEGGIRQVVRRIATPDLLAWTDRSARAAGGAWGLWAPGLLSHRCFSHPWPGAARP